MSDERTGAAPAPDEDLRASIAGALAASRSQGEQPPRPVEPTEKPADEPAQQPPAETPTEAPPSEPSEPSEPDRPTAAARDEERAPKAEEGSKAPSSSDTAAPQHWSTEDKAEFARISSAEEARQWSLKHYKRMETGFGQKLQRAAQLERDYGPIDQTVFTPEQRQLIERQGVTVNQVINNWANIERALDRGTNTQNQELRNQILARMIYNYGGEPARIAGLLQEFYDYQQQMQAQRGMTAGYVPDGTGQPNFRPGDNGQVPVNGAPNGLDNRIAMLEAHNYEQQRRIVEAFGNAKGSAGELLHPYFGEVRAKMSELARIQESQGQVPDLEALYTEAVWATDSTRDRLLSSQRQAEERRTAEERRAKAERAGRAGVSVNGAPGPGQAPLAVPDRTLRDEIRANLSNYRH